MFQFITKIRQRRRERKERKVYTHYLQCPFSTCRKKFWGQLPSGKGIQAFECRCPRCHVLITESNIIPTRRRVALKWCGAIAKAAWHCLAYPVKPLSATNKIVKLEAVMINEVARVEKKMDVQGEVIGKRLDGQGGVLAGIGGLLANMANGRSELQLEFEAFESKQITMGGDQRMIEYRGSRVTCFSRGGRTFIDTVKIDNGQWATQFFLTRCGKTRAEAFFEGDQALVGESHIAMIYGLSFRVPGEFIRKDVINLFERSYIDFFIQNTRTMHLPLPQLISKNKIVPFTFMQPLIVPGGRSLELTLESDNKPETEQPFSLQLILRGEELQAIDGGCMH